MVVLNFLLRANVLLTHLATTTPNALITTTTIRNNDNK